MTIPNDTIPTKECTGPCGRILPATSEFFVAHKHGKYGLQAQCRECQKAYKNAYNKSHPESNRRRANRYYHEHKDKVLAYRAENAEKIHINRIAYYAAHSERERAYQRKYYYDHIEEVRIRDAAYRMRHREKYRAYAKQYSITHSQEKRAYDLQHKEERRAYWSTPKGRVTSITFQQRRRARKHNLPNLFTSNDWQTALDYFDNRCAVCGRPAGFWHTLAADHWIPLSDPRPDNPGTVPWNIVPLCHSKFDGEGGCNNSKSNHDALEWLTKRVGGRKAKKIIHRICNYFNSVHR